MMHNPYLCHSDIKNISIANWSAAEGEASIRRILWCAPKWLPRKFCTPNLAPLTLAWILQWKRQYFKAWILMRDSDSESQNAFSEFLKMPKLSNFITNIPALQETLITLLFVFENVVLSFAGWSPQ